MSANNISVNGYNFYTVKANGRKYIIGGVPEESKDIYIAEAKDASAIVLITSNPQFCGGVGEVVKENPGIEVYATPAGLRNIKEIINRDINEKLIKDGMELDGIKFIVTPGLPWVDTVSVIYGNTLYSGELFSGGEDYYREHLKINRDFAVSALDRLCNFKFDTICPAVGEIITDTETAFSGYRAFTKTQIPAKKLVSVIYSSRYGFTKSLAEYAKDKLCTEFEVYLSDAETADKRIVDKSDMLIIGTNTINRNAPQKVWDIVTSLDLVNKRSMPYFVFGSFGWAGDGIKLIDKTLQAMGMKQASKPVEVLFAPSDKDFEQMDKAITKLVSQKL